MCARGNSAALFTNPQFNNCVQIILQNRLWIDSPRAVSQCLLRPTIRKTMRTKTRAPPPYSRKATSNGPGWLSPCEIFCYLDRWTRSRCVCSTGKTFIFFLSFSRLFRFHWRKHSSQNCAATVAQANTFRRRCLPQRSDAPTNNFYDWYCCWTDIATSFLTFCRFCVRTLWAGICLQMNQVLDAMFERKVQVGEIVIRQGDDGDNFYVIES